MGSGKREVGMRQILPPTTQSQTNHQKCAPESPLGLGHPLWCLGRLQHPSPGIWDVIHHRSNPAGCEGQGKMHEVLRPGPGDQGGASAHCTRAHGGSSGTGVGRLERATGQYLCQVPHAARYVSAMPKRGRGNSRISRALCCQHCCAVLSGYTGTHPDHSPPGTAPGHMKHKNPAHRTYWGVGVWSVRD